MSSIRQAFFGTDETPANSADAFALAYDRAPEFGDQDHVAQLIRNHKFDLAVEEIASAASIGSDIADAAQRCTTGDLNADHLAVLVGIDTAFGAIHPRKWTRSSADVPGLAVCLEQYMTSGHYSDAADGAVLPRFVRPGREPDVPEGLSGLFDNLIRVCLQDWEGGKLGGRKVRNSHRRLPIEIDPWEFSDGLTVACAPVIESASEMRCRPVVKSGHATYHIEPKGTTTLYSRFAVVLHELDVSGAILAVLPEVTLPRGGPLIWSRLMRSNSRPKGGRLRLVLIGTGHAKRADAEAPANRAYLFNRDSGELIATQDKMFGFTTTGKQLAEWGFGRMAKHGKLDEHISLGSTLAILDATFGRIAVLICEDLARGVVLPRVECFGISMILTPVLDKGIKKFMWEHRRGLEYASDVGAMLVVSNSLATETGSDPKATSLASMIGHSAIGASRHGSDAVTFTFRADQIEVRGGADLPSQPRKLR